MTTQVCLSQAAWLIRHTSGNAMFSLTGAFSMYALFLKHKALPGRRNDLEAVWRRHMPPAIESNPAHLAYTYSFGGEPDVVAAFQIYRSREDADAFVRSPEYLAYIGESRPLLAQEPEITVLEPRWSKSIR
ncbi:MAG: hypothetical protein PGN25_03360 [Methylorubrum populi]